MVHSRLRWLPLFLFAIVLASAGGMLWHLRRSPDIASDAQNYLRQAKHAVQTGKIDAAHRLLDQVASVDKASRSRVHLLRGLAFERQLRFRAAIEQLELSSSNASLHALPAEHLVALYGRQLRREETLQALAQISTVRPLQASELVWVIAAGSPVFPSAESIHLLQQAVANDPEDDESQLALAKHFHRINADKEATHLLHNLRDTSVADSTLAVTATGLLLQIAVRAKQSGTGESLLSSLHAGQKATLELWIGLADCWKKAGQQNEEMQCLQRALQLSPTQIDLNYRFANLAQATGDVDQARMHFDLVSKLREVQEISKTLNASSSTEDLGAFREKVRRVLSDTMQPALAAFLAEPTEAITSTLNVQVSILLTQDLIPDAQQVWKERSPRESSVSGPTFVADEGAIDFRYFPGHSGEKRLYETIGGGVAVLDFDDDHWPDLFFPQGTRLSETGPADLQDRLFHNQGGVAFLPCPIQLEVENPPAFGIGCTAGDFDNDGDTDLFVTNQGANTLLCNNGDGTFSDSSTRVKPAQEAMSSSAAFADFDLDGDLDLYVVNYLEGTAKCVTPGGRVIACHPSQFPAAKDHLYINDGAGTFELREDFSDASAGKGLGILVAQFDDNQYPDVYIANDTTANQLYINKSVSNQLSFSEEGLESGVALDHRGVAQAGMGIAAGDVDGNGLTDLFVTNYYRESNNLYCAKSQSYFEDQASDYGITKSSWPMLGFGAQFLDADLDGKLDLFVANGHVDDLRHVGQPWKMLPQFFWQDHRASLSHQPNALNQVTPGLGRGCVRLDFNRDGRPDLLYVQQDDPVIVLRNDTPNVGNWTTVRLIGTRTNRDALNSKIHVQTNPPQYFELYGGDGFLSSNERCFNIPMLGEKSVQITVTWPGNQFRTDVVVNEFDTVLVVEHAP